MSDKVKFALQEMRRAELYLALSLSKAARSGTPKLYEEVARQISRAENRMSFLESELQVG
jgi:hypothetical protein